MSKISCIKMKSVVRNTLIRHAFNTCDQGRLKQELHYIWTSLQDLHNISQPKPSISKDHSSRHPQPFHIPSHVHVSHELQIVHHQPSASTAEQATTSSSNYDDLGLVQRFGLVVACLHQLQADVEHLSGMMSIAEQATTSFFQLQRSWTSVEIWFGCSMPLSSPSRHQE